MATRAKVVTKEILQNVAAPQHADTYTVITHDFVMQNTLEQLEKHGFSVDKEIYRANAEGTLAQGMYYLKHSQDDDMGMMFAWSNSYDKSMRFRCAIGGYVYTSLNGVIDGDVNTWGRKHVGTADQETIQTIVSQISNAGSYFNNLIADKNIMKTIILTDNMLNRFIGALYLKYNIVSNEQISIIKKELSKPSFDYNSEARSLWSVYNHVALSLKRSHPRNWMDHQTRLHMVVTLEFNLINYKAKTLENNYGEPENQTNLLTQIEEAEEVKSTDIIIEVVKEESQDKEFVEENVEETLDTVTDNSDEDSPNDVEEDLVTEESDKVEEEFLDSIEDNSFEIFIDSSKPQVETEPETESNDNFESLDFEDKDEENEDSEFEL